MAVIRKCDLCSGLRPPPSRYTLSHKTRSFNEEDPDRVSTISAGGIDVCADCWKRIAQPRMGRGGNQHRLSTKCDRCRETGTSSDTLRYSLKVSVRRSDGKIVTRGAGGLVLCTTCWVLVGKPKMRRGRHDILRILHI